ncbi:Fe-S cluster assembly ATPase SufC [Candidatus Woesearchaeota archaeon]|nr:Fe-S cluster assembly ATPase SufC [Candidatus Woesearchaeota archaeon]
MKLELRDLHVSVEGKNVLNGISLVINPGEVHALMGPNGGGKSTLSAVIAGHPRYKVEQGDILVDGKSIIQMPAYERARLGVFLSFQHPVELQGVSLSKLLLMLAKLRNPSLSIVEFKRCLLKNLQNIGVDESFVNRETNVGFSGGEKKRAEVLQLLTLQPSLAVLDELDSGLDVDTLRVLASSVNDLRGSNFSALVITHYPRLLEYIKPDFVHVLAEGKIVASGSMKLAREVETNGYQKLVSI